MQHACKTCSAKTVFRTREKFVLPWLWWFSKTRAATPFDCLDIECAGVAARDAGLNISAQLIELHLVEVFFFFHQAQCLPYNFACRGIETGRKFVADHPSRSCVRLTFRVMQLYRSPAICSITKLQHRPAMKHDRFKAGRLKAG